MPLTRRTALLLPTPVLLASCTAASPAAVPTATAPARPGRSGDRLAVLPVEVPSADGRTAKNVSFTYSDYGKIGRPRKPPAKDVFELPKSLG